MPDVHSATTTLNASAGMRRRVLLAAGVAATLPATAYGRAIVVSPQSPGPSAELVAKVADYGAIVRERDEISEQLDELEDGAPSLRVRVSEVMTNPSDYYHTAHEEEWCGRDLKEAFHHYSNPLIYVDEAAGKRILSDYARAEELARKRLDTYHEWVQSSGTAALEERDKELWARQRDLRDAICKFPCQSVEDVFAKVRFAKVHLHDIDSDYADELANIVRSMLLLASVDEQVSALRSTSEALNASPA